MDFSKDFLSIVIIEDNPLIAQDIKEILICEKYSVTGVFNSPQAFRASNLKRIDLAILDINLNAEETGVDLAFYIKEKYKANHIFITSYYDKKTVEYAGKSNPLAYLVKPYNESEILANIQLAIQKIKVNNTDNKYENHIFVKTSLGLKKLSLIDILYIEAYDIYSKIYLINEKFTISYSLKQLEEQLPEDIFMRIHRSYIINIKKIDIIKDNEIKMNDFSIPIGRSFKQSFFDSLKIY
jgi:DNA-binding LytR/AlgR family response regulator